MKTNKNAALLLLILSALMFFGIFQAAYADDITEPPSVVEPAPDPTPTADPGEPTPEPTGEPENPRADSGSHTGFYARACRANARTGGERAGD